MPAIADLEDQTEHQWDCRRVDRASPTPRSLCKEAISPVVISFQNLDVSRLPTTTSAARFRARGNQRATDVGRSIVEIAESIARKPFERAGPITGRPRIDGPGIPRRRRS